MARIIVLPSPADANEWTGHCISCPLGNPLMDEEVRPVHLADEHASLQVIERLAWAVSDAE